MKLKIWDAFALLFFLAVLYLLVKPNSYASTFVKDTSEALSALITYATAG